jgi:ribosomal protein S17E
MTREEWYSLCFSIAEKHPEYLNTTFEAFSAGVQSQADCNSTKVANMAAALSGLYGQPKEERWRKLARDRMLESRVFNGTPFEEKLLKENQGGHK